MQVRVLRLIEYVYNSPEAMQRDMAHWNLGANATHDHGHGRISSTILTPEFLNEEQMQDYQDNRKSQDGRDHG